MKGLMTEPTITLDSAFPGPPFLAINRDLFAKGSLPRRAIPVVVLYLSSGGAGSGSTVGVTLLGAALASERSPIPTADETAWVTKAVSEVFLFAGMYSEVQSPCGSWGAVAHSLNGLWRGR